MATNAAPVIRENSTTTNGTNNTLSTTTYLLYSDTWAVRPSDGLAFTKADIDSLEIGVRHDAQSGTGVVNTTQVYVTIDYTAPISKSFGLINGA